MRLFPRRRTNRFAALNCTTPSASTYLYANNMAPDPDTFSLLKDTIQRIIRALGQALTVVAIGVLVSISSSRSDIAFFAVAE